MKQKLLPFALLASALSFAQSWNLTGNSGIDSSTNFIGTTDSQPLVLKSNNIEGMRIKPNGDVVVARSENTVLTVENSSGRFQIARSSCNGCYGGNIGDTVLRNNGGSHTIILALPNNNDDGSSYIGIQDATRGTWVKFLNNGIARIDGKIYAKEIEVKANVWADYVFKKDYKLRTLDEVEKHIKEKGHLPNIPSAKEVEKEGINLGEMDAKLLEKIEELTLYSIEQNKKIQKLEKQVEQLLNAKK